jgi:hypothetical protein
MNWKVIDANNIQLKAAVAVSASAFDVVVFG